MRVLQIVKTSVGAGWALRQMRELVRLGVEVHVAIPPGGPMIPQYEAAGITVHPGQFDIPLRSPWRWPALRREVRGLVSRVQPDLIHSHFVGTTLTMRLALGKHHSVPRVFQVPGTIHLEHPFFREAEIATAGAPDHWIGSCSWMCRRYRASGIPEKRVFLCYYGRDLDSFTTTRSGKLRGELGVDAETKLVGMVAYVYGPKRYLGQRRGLKGHEDFIDAMALVTRQRPEVLGVCIGGAWGGAEAYESRIHAYAAKRTGDRLRFLGMRRDVPEIYPDLDLAVQPSHSENLGAAIESLLSRVPTVVTDVVGMPDLVEAGETGRLAPPRNPARLASTILEALDNPDADRAMAARGQVRARRMFDIHARAAELRDIYSQILNSHGGQQ